MPSQWIIPTQWIKPTHALSIGHVWMGSYNVVCLINLWRNLILLMCMELCPPTCVCVCVHVQICVHVYTWYMYVYTCVHVCVHMLHVCVHMLHVCVYMCTCMCTHVYMYVYMYVYTCVHVCVHIHVCCISTPPFSRIERGHVFIDLYMCGLNCQVLLTMTGALLLLSWVALTLRHSNATSLSPRCRMRNKGQQR